MKARAAAGAVVALLLAGCASAADPLDATEPEADTPLALTTAVLGAIQGAVVDTSLFPVANASITLYEAGVEGADVGSTSSDTAGQFALPLLEPATYRLTVSAERLSSHSGLVTVRAAEVSTMTVSLDNVPTQEPYIMVLIKGGMLSCAGSYILSPSQYSCDNNPDEFNLIFDVPDGFELIITETDWDTSEYMGQEFDINNESTNAGTTNAVMALHVGPQPMRMLLYAGEEIPPENPDAALAGAFVPVPHDGFSLKIRNFYAGLLADEINQTAYPACSYTFSVRCSGVGFTLQFRFDLFVSVFVHDVPAGVETYSVLPDN